MLLQRRDFLQPSPKQPGLLSEDSTILLPARHRSFTAYNSSHRLAPDGITPFNTYLHCQHPQMLLLTIIGCLIGVLLGAVILQTIIDYVPAASLVLLTIVTFWVYLIGYELIWLSAKQLSKDFPLHVEPTCTTIIYPPTATETETEHVTTTRTRERTTTKTKTQKVKITVTVRAGTAATGKI